MTEYLTSISEHALLIQIVALFFAFILYEKKNAFLVCLFTFTLLGIAQVYWEYFLLGSAKELYEKETIRILWYFGFAISDWLTIIASVWICYKHQYLRDKATDLILISYTLHGFNQVIRYIDRVTLETNMLGAFYKMVVPTLNVAICAVVFICIARALYNRIAFYLESRVM